ncbi:hypothetical protein EV360DRAFT_75325 [Lentinula raphanica]|nr:hypothetical protein EV360DRAFT_75325 [Lentinula raphanica]
MFTQDYDFDFPEQPSLSEASDVDISSHVSVDLGASTSSGGNETVRQTEKERVKGEGKSEGRREKGRVKRVKKHEKEKKQFFNSTMRSLMAKIPSCSTLVPMDVVARVGPAPVEPVASAVSSSNIRLRRSPDRFQTPVNIPFRMQTSLVRTIDVMKKPIIIHAPDPFHRIRLQQVQILVKTAFAFDPTTRGISIKMGRSPWNALNAHRNINGAIDGNANSVRASAVDMWGFNSCTGNANRGVFEYKKPGIVRWYAARTVF